MLGLNNLQLGFGGQLRSIGSGVPPAAQAVNRSLSSGGDSLTSSGGFMPFLNVMRQASVRTQVTSTYTDFSDTTTDATGFATAFAPGVTAYQFLIESGQTDPEFVDADYILKWDGVGTVAGAIDVKNFVLGGDGQSATFTGGGAGTVWGFKITSFDGSDPCRNFRWTRVGDDTTRLEAGEEFRPEIIADLKKQFIYRFMDTQGTNGSLRVDASDFGPDTFWRGMSLEAMCRLCNEAKTYDPKHGTYGPNPWFCVPEIASDAAIQSMATRIAAVLDTDFTINIEFSNESWNNGFRVYTRMIVGGLEMAGTQITGVSVSTGSTTVTCDDTTGMTSDSVFAVGPWNRTSAIDYYKVGSVDSATQFTIEKAFAEATVSGGTGYHSTNAFTTSHHFAAKKSCETLKVFEDQITAEATGHTVKKILGLQTAVSTAFTEARVEAAIWQAAEPGNYVDPAVFHDYAACTSYYGTSGLPDTLIADIEAQIALPDLAAARALLHGYMQDRDSTQAPWGTYDALVSQRAYLKANGLDMLLYEGGSHLIHNSDEFGTTFANWYLSDYFDSAENAADYTLLSQLSMSVVDGPANNYIHIRKHNNVTGTWGMKRGPWDTNAVETALFDFAEAKEQWWGANGTIQTAVPLTAQTVTQGSAADSIVIDHGWTVGQEDAGTTFEIVSGPAGVSITKNANNRVELSGVFTAEQVATPMVITATDSSGNTATQTFDVTVEAGVFDPATLFASGQEGFWIEAEQSATYQDTAGTVVAAEGDPVGRIDDLSGNGNHLLQGTAGMRPLLTANASGRLYLDFDQIDDFLGHNFSDPNVFLNAEIGLAVIYEADGRAFMLMNDTVSTYGANWIGLGLSGGTGVNIAGVNFAPGWSFNVDGVASTATNLGEFHTEVQAGTLAVGNVTHNNTSQKYFNPRLGTFRNDPTNYGAVGPIYAVFLRKGHFSASEIAALNAYKATLLT